MTRYSSRLRSPKLQDGMRRVAIEGHGSYYFRDNRVPKIVPPGRELVLLTDLGIALGESHCRFTGKTWRSYTTPLAYCDSDGDLVTSCLTGDQSDLTGHMRVYRGGERYPDLRLFPYNDPNSAITILPSSYVLEYDPINPQKYEKLSEILERPSAIGCQFFWLACSTYACGFKPAIGFKPYSGVENPIYPMG